MFVEVVNFEEVEDGGADLEVECDREFLDLARDHTGEQNDTDAVREFVTESILRKINTGE